MTRVEDGDIERDEIDLGIELSTKEDGRAAYASTFAASAKNPASAVTVSLRAGNAHPLVRRWRLWVDPGQS